MKVAITALQTDKTYFLCTRDIISDCVVNEHTAFDYFSGGNGRRSDVWLCLCSYGAAKGDTTAVSRPRG